MSLAALLARAKATAATVVPSAPPAAFKAWQPIRVDLGVEVLRGRFHFEDADWVHWIDLRGDHHASQARFVTKEGT